MKKLLVLLVVILILALALPIANLVIKPQVKPLLTTRQTDEPGYAQAAALLQSKCLVCHVQGEELPFYANLPGAKSKIQMDVDKGTTYINLAEALNPGAGKTVSEPALAMVEYALTSNRMPPMKYAVLHWDSKLNKTQKETVYSWIHEVRKKHYLVEGVAPQFAIEPVQPLPVLQDSNPEKTALGNKMFHDVRLSHDNTLSCASCHGLDKGGTDRKDFSVGINAQVGDINAPTVFNSGFNFIQFWDGRAADLQAQADGPVNNPIEMGSNWGEAIPKLQQDPEVVAAFTKLYPDGLNSANVMNSIATFEKTLITTGSRFDKYLMGDTKALNDEEKQGYQLFKDHACAACHSGKILGGQSFEKLGLMGDYFADRGNIIKRDNGRFNVTQKESDKFRFKVPTLRNIDKTGPYFHDATQKTIRDAVTMMGRYQSPTGLTQKDADLIEKFLLTLTGEYNGKPL